ncbi:polymeric immunoglobulin receptor-like [Neoarius graeffei]|uniref:polymeric immunoglobulin receptor-like n=1 Tax=Neoarius graeffei TaxID=443677 RepID=UPI00298CDBB2|nr:polymeric immunoglobulin receptor-like [Neoarius graeffei]
MKILLIFTLCLISGKETHFKIILTISSSVTGRKVLLRWMFGVLLDGGASKEVTGYSGGGVLIKCEYNAEYIKNLKYFCKGLPIGCNFQIKTGDKNEWVNSGRFSLFDDAKSAEFWVMIRELTVQDTGTYQCGVDQLGIDVYTPVELKVKEGAMSTREVSAYAGTRSNIKCRYEDEYKSEKKSFSKMETDQWGFKHISTHPNSEWAHDGRFSVHDNRSAGFFSVFIRELITEDTGTYSCAVVLPDETEIYTVVKLNVAEDISFEKSISETVHVGEDLTVSCKYPESLRNASKFFCKRPKLAACLYDAVVPESRKSVNNGKSTLYDDWEKQIFTVSMKDVTEQDSGEYWCGAEVAWTTDHGYKVYFTQINLTATGFSIVPIVITVCSSLLVLLIGISFLIVALRNRCKYTHLRIHTCI